MQNYQEKAIPLISRKEDNKYHINPEALDFLQSLQGHIAIISVAGMYRTGKSFLLNTILLNNSVNSNTYPNNNKHGGFAVGPTTNPKTKGIWIWGKPLVHRNDRDQIVNVLIMDSEGLGSTQEDVNHDLRIFVLTLLLSSTFMYNTIGAIEENAIDSLGVVLKLCQHLKNEKYNDFPDFYWILRDFSLTLVDKDNKPLTPKMYLESCLASQAGDSEIRNKIRGSIKSAFKTRNLFTLIRPLMDETNLQALDKRPFQQLRPEFIEQILQFRKLIFSNLQIKTVRNKPISGRTLAELLQIYTEAINDNRIPVVETGWEQLCLKQLHEVLGQIEEAIAARLNSLKGSLPKNKKQLAQEQNKIVEEFQTLFRNRLSNNDKAQQYFGKAVQEIMEKQMKNKGIQIQMKSTNNEQVAKFVKKQFESIQKRLKQGQFKNMGQLVKQFELFYQYYRKKCPYKDDLFTGMQCLLKKFSDSSMIMYKKQHNQKQAQITELNQQIKKITSQYILKQQKSKCQKSKIQDIKAKLQTQLSQYKRQNQQINQKLLEYEQKIIELQENNNKKQQYETTQQQNLKLKHQILELQNTINQQKFKVSEQLSKLNNQIMLKQNQIANIESYKAQLQIKMQENVQENLEKTHALQQTVEELKKQLQNLTKNKQIQKLTLSQKIQDKEKQLKKIQNALQAKCQEINKMSKDIVKDEEMQNVLREKDRLINQLQQKIKEISEEKSILKQKIEEKMKILESQLNGKQNIHIIKKLELEQENALLTQKLQFIQKQCEQKSNKNKMLLSQNQNYVTLFEQKDQKIQNLEEEIEQLKNYDQAESEQIQMKISEMASDLEKRGNCIRLLEEDNQRLTYQVQRKLEDLAIKEEEINIITHKSEESYNQLQRQLQEIEKSKNDQQNQYQLALEQEKSNGHKYLQEQKRSSELSLVQLKNYYQMEKQRLQKKILQQRRKSEYIQADVKRQIQTKYKTINKTLNEEIMQLKLSNEQLEQQLDKIKNQTEMKLCNMNQQVENQKKNYQNKFISVKRQFEQLNEELNQNEQHYQESRLNFVKQIEGISYQLTRKQKQICQLNAKYQKSEAASNKKDQQIQNIKKTMHQQIQSSIKKVGEAQGKTQKINEEYMHFKIAAEKQNALCKQRNQFLTARLGELSKEKQSGSMKNLQKLDRSRMIDLKEQLEKIKSQNIILQSKIQVMRRNQKQYQNLNKKSLQSIEKQLSIVSKKLQTTQAKKNQLQNKLLNKETEYKKSIQQIMNKYNTEKSQYINENDNLNKKNSNLEQQKNKQFWKLEKQCVLLQQKVKYVEYQRDENKKELQENQNRLQATMNQLKKNNQKSGIEESGTRRQSVDKRYNNQLELMKMSTKVRQEQLEQTTRRLKEENKNLKHAASEYTERVARYDKQSLSNQNLTQQLQSLQSQYNNLLISHRQDIKKDQQEYKIKLHEYEKKLRELQRKNSEFIFILEKEKKKYNMQKQALEEQIKQLEDKLAWEFKKNQQIKKGHQLQKSRSSKQFSMTGSDLGGKWR